MPHARPHATNKPWAHLLRSAVLTAAGAAFIGGCEKMESGGRGGDRLIDDAVSESVAAPDPVKAIAALGAVKPDSSDVGKVRTASELARNEYNVALSKIADYHREALSVSGALFDFRQAAREITDIQMTAKDYSSTTPPDPASAIDDQRKQVDAALAKVKASAQETADKIAAVQKEIADLTAERDKAVATAKDLETQSRNAKGEESLKLFKQSIEASTKAGTLGAQIEVKQGGLLPLTDRQSANTAVAEAWDSADANHPGAIQRLEQQKQGVAAAAAERQTKVKTVGDLAGNVVANVVTPRDKDDAKKLTANAGARLRDASRAADAAFAAAEKSLKSASQHAADAQKAAQALYGTLSKRTTEATSNSPTSTELGGLKSMVAAFNVNQYALQKGTIDTALGNLYADQAALAKDIQLTTDALSTALKASNLPVPTGMPKADAAAAQASSDKAFAEAEKSLEAVVGAKSNLEGDKEMKTAAASALQISRAGRPGAKVVIPNNVQ